MALVTRLSRLFQADFHAVLDRIEEPDIQLKQAVREMQLALDQDKQRLSLLQHESNKLNKAAIEAGSALQALDEELDICLAAKKDELARDLIRRKLVNEKQLLAIKRQTESIESQTERLATQIDEQSQQLASMKQKLELLVAEENRFVVGELNHADTIRNEEVEIALLREKQLREKQRRDIA
jgi:phage shock protein A